ncbi:MAG TPA: type II CAAX endopeptidase family protein [Verrucomicrobiae bacterium]|nr:type II CAAX endopeptidase family protein [Verrucomicrobiae bacterium]
MLSEKPWKPELVVRLLAGLFSSMLLGVLIVNGYESMASEAGKQHRDLLAFAVGIISFHGVGLVLVHVFLQQHHVSWSEAFGFREPRLPRALFLAVITVIVMLPITLSLTELSRKILVYFQMPVEAQQAVKIMQVATSHAELALHGIATVILAPFVEELFFRGILYPTIKQSRFHSLALWGTSFFFALSHSNLLILLPLTVLAIILTFLYETTNNLLAPIVAHSLFNAANYAFLLFQKYQEGLL